VFAHYDAQNEVKDYVLFHLAALRPLCARLVFVSTSSLDAAAQGRARTHADDVHLHVNAGFDFGMWRSVLLDEAFTPFDVLLLTNSSVFGPVNPLAPIVTRMETDACDFWGMTESRDFSWHLQSYFLGFKPRAVASPAFRRFWEGVQPWQDKFEAIRGGEVALTGVLTGAGLAGRPAFPTSAIAARAPFYRRGLGNPTAAFPGELLDAGMPYLKVNVMRDNPFRVARGPLRRRLKVKGYDESLIAFDRRPGPEYTGMRGWMRHPAVMPISSRVAKLLGR